MPRQRLVCDGSHFILPLRNINPSIAGQSFRHWAPSVTRNPVRARIEWPAGPERPAEKRNDRGSVTKIRTPHCAGADPPRRGYRSGPRICRQRTAPGEARSAPMVRKLAALSIRP